MSNIKPIKLGLSKVDNLDLFLILEKLKIQYNYCTKNNVNGGIVVVHFKKEACEDLIKLLEKIVDQED